MKSKKVLIVFLLCFSCTLFSLILHILPINNTMINYVGRYEDKQNEFRIEDRFIEYAVNYHKTEPAFKRRPVTTYLVEKVSFVFNLRIGVSFVWVNFLATFLCGFLIYYLARLYLLTYQQALLSVVFYYFSFSVLLGYFIPIATYDEPLQYLFILIGLIFFKQQRYWLFSIAFALATIVRDSSLILFPAIFLFMGPVNYKSFFKEKKQLLYKAIIFGTPVLLYVLFLMWFYDANPDYVAKSGNSMEERLGYIEKNFRDLGNVTRTILSMASVLLLPLFLLIRYKQNETYKLLLKTFWTTLVINTIVILFAAYAEESRVFVLPLLLLFPVFGKIITSQIDSRQLCQFLYNPLRLGVLALAGLGSWFMLDVLYELTDINCNENLFREYNTISFTCVIGIILYSLYQKKTTPE